MMLLDRSSLQIGNIIFLIDIIQRKKMRLQSLSNLPKVTQVLSVGAKFQTKPAGSNGLYPLALSSI